MSNSTWRELVVRYADGRHICNCGDAYLSPCGAGIDGDGARRTDMLVCKHGCSANQIAARSEIADKVLVELAASQVDAERYRKLRRKARFEWRNGPGLYWYLPRYYGTDLTAGERLDNSLDAEPT